MKTMNSIRDFFWVLQAFIRGKVLRQKNYQPHETLIYCLPGATVKRTLALMELWDFYPVPIEDIPSKLEKDEHQKGATTNTTVPYVHWTNGKITLDWDINQNGLDRFISIRRE